MYYSTAVATFYFIYVPFVCLLRRMNYADAIVYLKEHDIRKEDGTFYEFGEVRKKETLRISDYIYWFNIYVLSSIIFLSTYGCSLPYFVTTF